MRKLSVPLLKQDKLTCGVTALRMVLQYFGKDVSSSEIIRKIGGIKSYGIRTIKLADFARSLGFRVECYSYNKKLAKGKAEIRKPAKFDIIKFLKKHEKGRFWYNDPKDGKHHKIKEDDLMFAWFNNVLGSSAYLLVLYPKN
ncbi:MAG: cysteine peptidase family C39 domain-containing protein [Candidatus Diapherotrites archaeon]